MKVDIFFQSIKPFLKKYNINLIHKNKYAYIYDIGFEHLVLERNPEKFINCYFTINKEVVDILRIDLERPINTFRVNVRRRMLRNLCVYDKI